MGKWNTNTVPECEEKEFSDEVLVTVVRGCFKRVLKAVYVPYHHCTSEDVMWEENLYEGNEWIPEGWYEVCDNTNSEYTHFPITDKVVAWMKLPKAYEDKLTDLSLVTAK